MLKAEVYDSLVNKADRHKSRETDFFIVKTKETFSRVKVIVITKWTSRSIWRAAVCNQFRFALFKRLEILDVDFFEKFFLGLRQRAGNGRQIPHEILHGGDADQRGRDVGLTQTSPWCLHWRKSQSRSEEREMGGKFVQYSKLGIFNHDIKF